MFLEVGLKGEEQKRAGKKEVVIGGGGEIWGAQLGKPRWINGVLLLLLVGWLLLLLARILKARKNLSYLYFFIL